MNSGEIVLTFPAACAVCRAPIPHGTRVWWDAGTGEISCAGPHLADSRAASPATRHPIYDQERAPSLDDRRAWSPRADERRDDPRYDGRYDDRYDDRPRYDDRYAPRYDDRYGRRDDRHDDPRYDGRYDDRPRDGRYDDRYDDPRAPQPISDSPQRRRWDPLDIDAPDWWSAFDPRSMAPHDVAVPEPAARVPEPLDPRPVAPDPVAPEPVAPEPVAPEPVEERGMPAPPTDTTWPTPGAGPRRRHSGLTTVITPGGIAGLPPAHRRTSLIRPRSSWDTTSLLNLALGRSGVMLDRRLVPGDARVLDHVVVAPSGVFVVTVKSSRGLVERRSGSTMSNTRDRLLVDGRERHRALRSAHLRSRAVADVVARLGNGWEQVPVRPVLCYVDAEWRPFAQPFEVEGVTVVWPKQFGSVVNVDPVISARSVDALAAHLDTTLRRA